MENFWFDLAVASDPKVLSASASSALLSSSEIPTLTPKIRSADVEISAKSAISIAVNDNGEQSVMFEKNSGEILPIASLSKLMTAYAAFELYKDDFSKVITVDNKAANLEWSTKFDEFKAGDKLTASNLLYAMLIESSNHAAYAITDIIGQEPFVGMMNIYAKDLGLRDTEFSNSTGLEPDNPDGKLNVSTAKNMARLAGDILKKYPQIFEITTNKSFEVIRADGTDHHFIPENTNKLLGQFSEIIGGKTGQSPAALGCLLVVLKNPRKEGSYFINVVLGSNDRFGDMEKIIKNVNGIEN